MADLVPGISEGDRSSVVLDATYYDTDDLTLARAGATLRYRSDDGWTVKLPGNGTGNGTGNGRSELRRAEITVSGRPELMPAAVRDIVRARVRSRPLHRAARLHTERSVLPLYNADGAKVAELVDDRVRAFTGRRAAGTFREIEFETTTNGGKRLRKAARQRLTRAGCDGGPAQPKVIRVLGERAVSAPELVVPDVQRDASLELLIQHLFAASTARLIECDPGVRLGVDPESLHRFRVAARTLRSQLRTFADALDREWSDVLRYELSWLGTEIGPARDLDVLSARMAGRIAALDAADRADAAVLMELLADQATVARGRALAALRCHRYDSLLDALVDASRAPALRPGYGDRSARRFARTTTRQQLRRMERAAAKVAPHPTDLELHRVRLTTKRTRYSVDAARPIFGAPAARLSAALGDLQDVLGELHDSVVAVQWLRDAASNHPRAGIAAGLIISVEQDTQRKLRRQWRGRWRATDNRALTAWLR